mgnify:CR=1 FL=1
MKRIKPKIILIAAFVLFVIISILYLFMAREEKKQISTPLAIVSSTPKEGSSGVSVFDPITITFNQSVDMKDINVTSDPTENWDILQTTPNTIKVEHDIYLRVATTYKLTITQQGSTVGVLTFETAREQNDPRLLQSLQSELDRDYPLASLTPYKTSNYRVIYIAPLTFEIEIVGSMSVEDAISQVQSWVKMNNIDPATHEYITKTSL